MARKPTDRDENPGAQGEPGIHRGRRRALQALTVGGAVFTTKSLPEQWTRPMVEAVVLPAHAQLSGAIYTGETMVTLPTTVDDIAPENLQRALDNAGVNPAVIKRIQVASAPRKRSMLDYVISPANATTSGVALLEASLEDNGDITVVLSFTITCPGGSSEETPELDLNLCLTGRFSEIEEGETTGLDSCESPLSARIVSIDGGRVTVRLSGPPLDTDEEVDLDLGGERPNCPDCDDVFEELGDFVLDTCGIVSPPDNL